MPPVKNSWTGRPRNVALPYVEIELRQDLLRDGAGLERWTEKVGRALLAAEAAYRSAT